MAIICTSLLFTTQGQQVFGNDIKPKENDSAAEKESNRASQKESNNAAEKESNSPAEKQSNSATAKEDFRDGAMLFQTQGCYACHNIHPLEQQTWRAGKLGPELLRISSKVNKQWLVSWIRDPTGNAELSSGAHTYASAHLATKQSIENGKRLFYERGCTGCHDLGKQRSSGPRHIALDGIGSKVEAEWLYSWIEDPQKLSPKTVMPNFALSSAEISQIADFLREQKDAQKHANVQMNKSLFSQAGNIDAGGKLIGKYGCHNCHYIPGFENNSQKVGPDLSDYGNRNPLSFSWGSLKHKLPKQEQNWQTYTSLKLADPHSFDTKRIKKIMPIFSLSEFEKDSLIVFLRGLREKPEYSLLRINTPSETALVRGNQIINNYGCLGCHSIHEKGKVTLYQSNVQRWATLAPALGSEGGRVKADWLEKFLKEPQKIRPHLSTTMPRFHFKEGDLNSLLRYFDAQQSNEKHATVRIAEKHCNIVKGNILFKQFNCAFCHNTGSGEPEIREKVSWYQDRDAARKMAPDLSFANERIRPEWMLAFMQNPHAFIPDASMPYMALSSEEAQAIRLYISKLKAQKKIEAAPLPKSTPTQVPERIHK